MTDAALTIQAGWKMQTDTGFRDIFFDDPARFGYPNAFPGQVVDRISTGVQTTCEARLTTAEAIRIGEALQAGDRLTIERGRICLTGWFQLEHDDAGYLLTGRVERVRYA